MDLLLQPKRGKEEKSPDASSAAAPNVVVAVKASKEISRAAILWALAHVVQPGDCVTLLVVLPTHRSGRRLWGFPRFSGDCAHSSRKSSSSTAAANATDWCSQMLLKLNDAYDPTKINVKVKSVPGSPSGSVAAESKKVNSSWVVLDKHLKDEEKRCLEELQCNIVVMKGKSSQPKVLRLNLVAPEEPRPSSCPLPPSKPEKPPETSSKTTATATVTTASSLNQARVAEVTPNSSPEVESSFTATTDPSTSSASSSDTGASPSSILSEIEQRRNNKKEEPVSSKERNDSDTASSGSEDERASSSAASVKRRPWVTELLNTRQLVSELVDRKSQRFAAANKSQNAIARAITEKLSKLDGESTAEDVHSCRSDVDYSTNVREVISLTRNAPPGPPPLCSICQHKAPVFGKPPRWFSYAELELATGGFSKANFLAEGGFGSVHRGVLPDGQAVAVKQHKLASCQGDLEFCSEVEVLSCAQHRNVVMLIGYCIEGSRRLLVYEYICNGSLDTHLYGSKNQTLEWSARQKIAVGAARGLRYLHEECRVGCIVHRDMRPNNILITHDFEPLVGDFGLARWQPDGDLGVDTRVIGTFGYLAPEYAQSGQVTEKADVYSFGVVLVELITGRKAVDINRPKGQQCLSEWARPLLEHFAVKELIDPRLGSRYSEQEVAFMVHAASLCIRRDPNARPRMSQVLRILEGDVMMECNYTSPLNYDISGSGRYHRVPSRHDDNEDDDHKTGSFREDVGNLGEKMSCGTSIRCPEPMSASKRYSFT